jgi:sporulation protein, ylmC/ymxH family
MIEVIFLKYTLSELRNKEVVETKTGIMLGRIDDIEINADDSSIDSVIVYGRPKLFGLMGRDSDIVIKYRDIDLIGKDAILVTSDVSYARKEEEAKLIGG